MNAPPTRNHPVFAPLYNALTWLGEATTLGRWRSEALAPAFGRLLVVGLGPGHDLAHLPAAVTDVVAVEPAAAMRRISKRRARSRARSQRRRPGVPIRLVDGVGERLPLPDASVDSALCALVLCSVEDPGSVLREIARVLRPNGVLCVLEHVRASDASRLGRIQDAAAPAWARIAGGCRPHRRTRSAIEQAGFDVSGLADRTLRLTVPLLTPTLIGSAAAPSTAGKAR